jgi:DNA-binding NtrC family response regulator
VRIIAATNVDLKQQVREGKFREDLFYRLNVITIDLPPLRQRKEDIPLLAAFFLNRYSEENERPTRRITPEALRPLLTYSWPGNVRELENVIERAVVLSAGVEVGPELPNGRVAVRHHRRLRAADHCRNAGEVQLESNRCGGAFPHPPFHFESKNQTPEHRYQEESERIGCQPVPFPLK